MERLDRKARIDALKVECVRSYLKKDTFDGRVVGIIVDYRSINRLLGIHQHILSADSSALDKVGDEVVETMEYFKNKPEDGRTLFSCMNFYPEELVYKKNFTKIN